MLIIGHRGARGLAKENTLKAIRKGLEVGVDMVEVDVRLHSRQLVLSHDPTLKTGEYCLLSDALLIIDGVVPVILELKEIEVVKHMPAAVENYMGKIIFSSKKYDVLQKLKKKMPDVNVAVTEKWSGLRAVAEASLLNTHQIHINHKWLWGGFVRSMKHRGYELYAYTVNSVERAKELDEWGVDAIFTDYPNRFNKK